MADQKPVRNWIPVVLAAWIVPGAGHFVLKRQFRGLILGLCVLVMFLLGLMMRGAMFQPQGDDMLTRVIYYGGYLAHIITGLPYFLTTALGYNQQDTPGLVYDYGSKFLVGAGLLNVLAMVDAYEIAKGMKD